MTNYCTPEYCQLWEDDCPLRCAGTSGANIDPPALYVSSWSFQDTSEERISCQCQTGNKNATGPVFAAEGATSQIHVVDSSSGWFQQGFYSEVSFTDPLNLVALQCSSPDEALACRLSRYVDFALSSGQAWFVGDIYCVTDNRRSYRSRLRDELGDFTFLSEPELGISDIVDAYSTDGNAVSLLIATTAQGFAAVNAGGNGTQQDIIIDTEGYIPSAQRKFTCNHQRCFDEVQAFLAGELHCDGGSLFATNATAGGGTSAIADEFLEDYGVYVYIAVGLIALVTVACCCMNNRKK